MRYFLIFTIVLLLIMNKLYAVSEIKGEHWAILIGINDYTHWRKLNTAVKDTTELQNLLITKYGYKKQNVHSLQNDQATGKNILAKFVELDGKLGKHDSLLVYYAGHGIVDIFNAGAWVPVDAPLDDASRFIDTNKITHMFNSLPAHHVFVVSDSCFSGAMLNLRGAYIETSETEKLFNLKYNKKSRQALSSGGLEPVLDSGKNGHSIFAYHFIRLLRENTDPYLSAANLSRNLEKIVSNNADQVPSWSQLRSAGDEDGQFYFINLQSFTFAGKNAKNRKPGIPKKNLIDASFTQNREIFREGEEVKIDIVSQSDQYVVVANRLSNDQYAIIFPNVKDHLNHVASNRKIRIPQMNSYRIILRTEPDEGITSEAFVFIGVPKDRNTETISWNDILPRTLISRDEFYELFERLHVRWISEKELKYSVTK